MKGGVVYNDYSSTHVDHETWIVELGASFHMTPHREWFCEYERYGDGDVLLGGDSKISVIIWDKLRLKLKDGRIIILPGVFHILVLAKNLIFVSNMSNASVKTMFENDICKMVWGAHKLIKLCII